MLEKTYLADANKRASGPYNFADYLKQYQFSIEKPAEFWAEQAQALAWYKPWDTVLSGDLVQANVRWFEGALLNVCFNCVDRHLVNSANETAIIWQGNEFEQVKYFTYAQLHEQICRLANVLLSKGISKGDRVCIYLPMIPEAIISMLACARIGAVHTVVFAGFSAESLQSRIQDTQCKLVITADEAVRGNKSVPLKLNVDLALKNCSSVTTVLVIAKMGAEINGQHEWEVDYRAAIADADINCPCVVMAAEDPLFILYTSGSTGKPKGVLHTTAGYLLYTTVTFKQVFDYRLNEIYWCTADVGWITGHSYMVYGPLANRATILIYEGIPTYPDVSRCWQIIDQHKVNIFYTAPTLIRMLMRSGNEPVQQTKRSSLRLLGTVGEPINPEVWEWYYQVVGAEHCPVIDTWWQTETGGFMLTAFAEVTSLKPGYAGLPFFGVKPALVDNAGKLLMGENSGNLVMAQSWPGQMRTVYGDHQRYIDTYLTQFPGYYYTGDGALRDAQGFFCITGRVDDVINTAGHRIGTAEIESALVSNSQMAEAAVVGYNHPLKGQGICAFVIPKQGVIVDEALKETLLKEVVQHIGAIAKPDIIYFVNNLPKTRSGKIMRRILRKIVEGGAIKDLGDLSTLAEPDIIKELLALR